MAQIAQRQREIFEEQKKQYEEQQKKGGAAAPRIRPRNSSRRACLIGHPSRTGGLCYS